MKSDTNKKSLTVTLDTPVQFLKGIGPKIALLLAQKGVQTLRDALFYFPRDYQDRSQFKKISDLVPNEKALIKGTVVRMQYIPIRSLKKPILEVKLSDGNNLITLKWFQYNKPFFETKFKNNPSVIVYGSVTQYGTQLQIVHPEVEWDVDEDTRQTKGIVPIYSETEGLNQRILRNMVLQSLELGLPLLEDDLPEPIRITHQLISLKEAIKQIHFPAHQTSLDALRAFNTPEQKRIIFEEFFKFEWIIGKRRLNVRQETAKIYSNEQSSHLFNQFLKAIPFELTNDQMNAIQKIFEDLNIDKPMNRLLQGDVGCGKTLVAFASILPVIAAKGQAALMVPTEILAEQHSNNASKIFQGIATIGILSGSTKKSQREEVLAQLKDGKIDLIIGTHALLEDDVQFKELGLIIIDEQHRFGVDQRMRLRVKGKAPHVLSLTATPIPRTLALTAYGDLDVSIIRELPKGRADIFTKIFKNSEREEALTLIKKELIKGRQAYIIFPLVEESEKIDLANAVSGADELSKGYFKDFKIGLLHGRMKSQEKSLTMAAFKSGEIQILVSTTVVEVGVDVPNSTILMIEHAERFGLSQLHQLRGRIGRGTNTSYCILLTSGTGGPAYERLKAMEETRDGFKLAELDLQIRGPGEFLGTKQSGELQFQYASLVRDQILLQEARNSAFQLIRTDPDLKLSENTSLRNYMQKIGYLQQKRLETT